MPTGMQIYSPDGYLEIDTTTRIGSILDTIAVTANSQSGAITYPIYANEKITTFGSFTKGLYDHYPQVAVSYDAASSTATVSWNYPAVTWVDNVNPLVFKVYGTIYVMVG